MAGPGQWRYIAQRMNGNGALGQFLDFDLPLQGVELEDVTSGHNALSASISPEIPRLKAVDGGPLLDEWATAIWAEDPDGEIRGGGILTHSGFNGEGTWELECTDLSGITVGLPYTEANFWINIDPMDLYRHIWQYIQSQPNSNMGITIDGTRSPMLLGGNLIQRDPDPGEGFDLEDDPTAPELDEPQPFQAAPNRFASNSDWREAAIKALGSWGKEKVDKALRKWLNKDAAVQARTWTELNEDEKKIKKKAVEKLGLPPNPPGGEVQRVVATYVEPVAEQQGDPEVQAPLDLEYDEYKLNWYTNHDLSADIDDLATMTPFDWHMTHHWYDDEIRHHIRLGYPRLGRRRDDLRFVVGENIQVTPAVERDGTEYANEVLFLGAGEGSSQIIGRAFRDDGRIRRVAVISDPSVQSAPLAEMRARQELAKRFDIENIADIVLADHPHAPMGSVDLGDEILIEGETGWLDIEMWVKVVARRMRPEDGESMSLTVIRSDRLI